MLDPIEIMKQLDPIQNMTLFPDEHFRSSKSAIDVCEQFKVYQLTEFQALK